MQGWGLGSGQDAPWPPRHLWGPGVQRAWTSSWLREPRHPEDADASVTSRVSARASQRGRESCGQKPPPRVLPKASEMAIRAGSGPRSGSTSTLRRSFSSVQFSRSVVSDSLRPHESQHSRPPCPSPTPGVYSNSCPSSR